jgi:hypothetical protein
VASPPRPRPAADPDARGKPLHYAPQGSVRQVRKSAAPPTTTWLPRETGCAWPCAR